MVSLAAASAACATSVYDYPAIAAQHQELRARLQQCVQRVDLEGWEQACREGIELVGDDPLWHYNLACALAYRPNHAAAFEELEQAVLLGFRDVKAIESDADLKSLSGEQRFKDVLKRAQELGDSPPPGKPRTVPAVVEPGGTARLTESNLVWNFDRSMFDGLLELRPSADLGNPTNLAERYAGPAKKLVAAWLREGTAAGNCGDLYFNRDGGHSRPVVTNFPALTSVKMEKRASDMGLDRLTPNMCLAYPVVGNASLAMTQGFLWRSAGRIHLTDQSAAMKLAYAYGFNQFWVFPAVDDFSTNPTNRFDYFPGVSPCQLITEGRSWSDRRYVQAALAASASFRPETKRELVKRGLLAATLQWLFRRCRPGVESDADYLTSKAHPTAFGKKDLDEAALVKRAHGLRPEDIPPVALLALINSTRYPVRYPQPTVDYPDCNGEILSFTPYAIAMVLRDAQARRTVLVQARTPEEGGRDVAFAWAVVNGDPAAVKIESPLGDEPTALEAGRAQITIDRRRLAPGERIDVACFAKRAGTAYGAPSFISFSAVALEKRAWREDGRLESVDYTNPDGRYCDPLVALPRRWKDVYSYVGDVCTGFVRYTREGEASGEFTVKGALVTSRAADGSPSSTRKVRYITRESGIPDMPPELTYVEEE